MNKKSKDWKKFKDENGVQEEPMLDEEKPVNDRSNGLDHASYEELEEKLTLAEKQAHENWEKSVRAMAEVDNMRRRAERDVTNAHKYSLEKFSTSLLPIVDSLEQALQLSHTEADANMREGLELTMKLLVDALDKHGVKQLNPMGELFNPQEHEAMSMQESPDAASNTILMVFQKGYRLNDRVIRPARVIVAK
jgi:molecular chaperone GrpE